MPKMHTSKRALYSAVTVSATVFILMIILIFENYVSYSDTLIANEQKRLQAITSTIARSIESYVVAETRASEILTDDYGFKKEFAKFLRGEDTRVLESLQIYYNASSSRVANVQLLDKTGKVLNQYPLKDAEEGHAAVNFISAEEVQAVHDSRRVLISEVHFLENESPYFIILQPIIIDFKVEGFFLLKMNTEQIYTSIVEPVNAGNTGYASVKTNEAILLMHPNKEDIGKELMSVRKERYPSYDWTELEAIVDEQSNGGDGVGIYHSVWAGDPEKRRVKKFSAYSSATVGDVFWTVTMTGDYDEVVSIILQNYYYTILIAAMIFLSLVFSGAFLYSSREREKGMEQELKHMDEVKKLNKDLEIDIEQRKRLEIQLTRSKEEYQAIFDSSKDGIIVVDFKDGQFGPLLEVNYTFDKVLGYGRNNLLGMKFSDIDVHHNREMMIKLFYASDEGQALMYETELRTVSGSVVPVEINGTFIENDLGTKVVMVARDVTLRKQEEETLLRSEKRFIAIVNKVASGLKDENLDVSEINLSHKPNRKIASKLEAINLQLEALFKKEMDENKRKEMLMVMQSRYVAMGEMIGNIAHQWRQPLNTLTLITYNLEDNLDDGLNANNEAETKFLFDKARAVIQKMSETIDDFRYFFKPRDHKEFFMVSDAVHSTINLCEERLKVHNIGLSVVGDMALKAYGYGNQVSQVIINSLNNCIDVLIERKIIEPEIKIRLSSEGHWCTIAILDNGGGIPEEILEKIFDPYFTTKTEQNGTGLGLYMSKMIIERNFGGNIKVDNEANGACFSFTLPMIEGEVIDE